MPTYRSSSGSSAEDLFIDLFSDAFGAEKAGFLYSQYPFYDIYQNSRFADFVVETGLRRVAIEVDDEASHNKNIIAENKFYDHLLKQNRPYSPSRGRQGSPSADPQLRKNRAKAGAAHH